MPLSPNGGGTAHRILRRVVNVEPGEERALVLACLCFFFTFFSYFVLRPIRDETAVASGVRSIPFLFAGTLSAMLVAHPLYAALVVRFPVRRFVALTYHFFAANLVLFYLAARLGAEPVWTGRVFFVWTSVFNMFVVSVFWSVMADTFRSGQAKRLFAVIGVGGTLGSISGSAATALLVERLGVGTLLLVSAALLEVAVLLLTRFPVGAASGERDADAGAQPARTGAARRVIGGSVWAGVSHVARSPYLLGIAVYLVIYTLGSTVLYSAQTEIVGAHYESREVRTAVLARIEFATQLLTVVVQAFVAGHFIRRFGVGAALAVMPAVSVLGFAALGASAWGLAPAFATFVTLSVLRRASEFSISKPAREVLYTVVSREDKYKAKSFMDTFVYRAGDQLGAWGYAGLAALGLALTGIAWVTVPLAAVALGLAIWLGRRQREMARRQATPAPSGVALPVGAAEARA